MPGKPAKKPVTVKQAADSARTISGACALYADALNAWLTAAQIGSQTLQNVGNEMVGCYSRAFFEGVEVAEEFWGCRTLSEWGDLQQRAVRHSIDCYFKEAGAVSEILFNGCAEACEPLNECSAVASDQVRRSLAA